MDAVSYSLGAKQAVRIKKFVAEPDAISGLVTLPSTIAVGETITIPAGRVVVHPKLQVDGTLVVDGTLFIPSGGTYTADELDVTVVKQNGNVVANLNSPSLTGTPTAPTAAVGTDTTQLATCALVKASMELAPRMQLMTAQNSTSGTSIDFTGIPSWAKKITVMFNGVSTSGVSMVQILLGNSSGVENTGYIGSSYSGTTSNALSSGFTVITYVNAPVIFQGCVNIILSASNTWTMSSQLGASIAGPSSQNYCQGYKTLLGTLDRIRVTTVNGTDTFDAGQINVLYEG